ncbi:MULTISPECIES: hypothetical protein [unclassified Bradyrhizobium]|uniref:hypothetical protein n=1 Tax=unclassified Bradyrhizobium TaxID=2631580 RepID=UPI00247A6B93|nr:MULTISPECIES: hypothetical protein [unclassified Bradyrhizobium]WGS21074.1 hypothetical protein MTX22_04695 [Bradyrhizobium sp. ISRA463]WGS27991.1 hypothetical protein MTX19_02545 [Bradyrhizobium sp. ISRA464]
MLQLNWTGRTATVGRRNTGGSIRTAVLMPISNLISMALPLSCSACRSRNRKFQLDDALENDLATPATEITSRHGVDKRSLLPLAVRERENHQAVTCALTDFSSSWSFDADFTEHSWRLWT